MMSDDSAKSGDRPEGSPSLPAAPTDGELAKARIHASLAEGYADMGTMLPDGGRRRRLKGALLRVLRLVTRDQVAFNHETVHAIRQLADGHEQASNQTKVALDGLASGLDGLTSGLGSAKSDLVGLVQAHDLTNDGVASLEQELMDERHRLVELEGRFAKQAADLGTLRSDLAIQRSLVETLLTEARRRLPDEFDHYQLETFAQQLAGRFDVMFADFAEEHRGSFEDIASRLEEHLPIVAHLAKGTRPVVDVGSGRGEWLALLLEQNIPAYGIDSNADVAAAAAARGIDMRNEDALAHLRDLDEGSLGAVTGFHIIEHLNFPTQVELLDASLRALAPGGVVLFETPNPANIIVGASNFYVDPTHQRPVHPELLQFLVEQRGFVDVETVLLHPVDDQFQQVAGHDSSGSLKPIVDYLNQVFFGPRDFAVVGWKPPGRQPEDQIEAS